MPPVDCSRLLGVDFSGRLDVDCIVSNGGWGATTSMRNDAKDSDRQSAGGWWRKGTGG